VDDVVRIMHNSKLEHLGTTTRVIYLLKHA
jgi:hypothetical protein